MDSEELRRAAIFGELQDTEAARLLAVARAQQCQQGRVPVPARRSRRPAVRGAGREEWSSPFRCRSAVLCATFPSSRRRPGAPSAGPRWSSRTASRSRRGRQRRPS